MKTVFAPVVLLFLVLACGIPQEQFDAVTSDLQATRSDLDAAHAQVVELRNESTVTASVVLALERDIAEVKDEVAKQDALLSEANADIDESAERLAQMEQTIATLSRDLDSRSDDVENLRQDIDDLKEEEANSEIAISDLNQALSDRDATIQARLLEVASLGDDLKLANAANADLQRQVATLQTTVNDNSVTGVQADIDALKSERDALAAKVKQLATLTEEYFADPDIEISSSGLSCTGSMLPLLHCGDIVIMQTNLKHRDIQEGDIISFRRRDCTTGRSVTDSITLHRVVDIDAGWFVTQGDNNYTVDSCRLPLINVTGKLLSYIEDIYPEHYMETANYESIKTQFNDLQERFDRDLADYEEQVELLEDAEDDYKDGQISYSSYVNMFDDTEDDRLDLLEQIDELNDLADTFFGLQDLIIQRNYNDADWAHLVE